MIEKWIEAIHYTKADAKAAYLVKAIRENWQVPEEYLREIKEKQDREEEEKIEYIKIKQTQQEELRIETENRLPDFWTVQLNKKRVNLSACNLPTAPTAQVDAQAEGKTSKMLEVAIEEKRREIKKEWINSERINYINNET